MLTKEQIEELMRDIPTVMATVSKEVQRLQAENDRLREELDATECSHEDEEAAHGDTFRLWQEAKNENARLRKALEVFADEESWWVVPEGYCLGRALRGLNPRDFARQALEGKE